MNFKKWFEDVAEKEFELKNTLSSHGIVMFLKKGCDFFGAREDGRIAFARMKDKKDDQSEDLSFSAMNIEKLLKGLPSHHIFDKKSIKDLDVIDIDDIVDEFKNQPTQVRLIGFNFGNSLRKDEE